MTRDEERERFEAWFQYYKIKSINTAREAAWAAWQASRAAACEACAKPIEPSCLCLECSKALVLANAAACERCAAVDAALADPPECDDDELERAPAGLVEASVADIQRVLDRHDFKDQAEAIHRELHVLLAAQRGTGAVDSPP